MTQNNFVLKEETAQYEFWNSRNRIQAFVGGFGNGKTAIIALKSLDIALNYENARCLIGRATLPKLNGTTKKEAIKWIPKDWVAKWPTERDNTVYLKNGSALEFRHVRQEGKGKGEQSSNLLSATYDSIAIDQIDDPEFTHKDFMDLIGRLRGTARYKGDDPSMPLIGPQWLMMAANPTRNWFFRNVVNPFFIWKKTGIITKGLIYSKKQQRCLIDLFSASSHENVHNTGEGFIDLMESAYKGSMYDRYVLGKWDSYEGLIYPAFDPTVHVIEQGMLRKYIEEKLEEDELGVIESYDFGQTSPSCYLLWFYNKAGDLFIVDGFYEPLTTIGKQADKIKEMRRKWGVIPTQAIYADPDIFRGKHSTTKLVGESVARMFQDEGIDMQRGNNSIESGISKVSGYLAVEKMHMHPVLQTYGAPRLFFGSEVEFLHNEIVDYYWNKNILGENVDKPRDLNDHAMDAMKYGLTRRPKVVGVLIKKEDTALAAAITQWSDQQGEEEAGLAPRHR